MTEKSDYRNVKNWISSDKGMYDYWFNAARRSRSLYDLSKELESELTDQALDMVGTNSLFTDLLTSSLRKVCWIDVAKSFWDAAGRDDEDDGDEQGHL